MAERFLASLSSSAAAHADDQGSSVAATALSSLRLHFLSMILKSSADLFRTVEHHSPRGRYQQRPSAAVDDTYAHVHWHASTAASVRGEIRPMLSTSGCAVEVLMLLLYSTFKLVFAIGALLCLPFSGTEAHAHAADIDVDPDPPAAGAGAAPIACISRRGCT
jgi:hypothetical protein